MSRPVGGRWLRPLQSAYRQAARVLPIDHAYRYSRPMCALVDERIEDAARRGGVVSALRVLAAELFDLALICVQLRIAVARRPTTQTVRFIGGRLRRRYPSKSIATSAPRYLRRPISPWSLDGRRRYRAAIGRFPFPVPLSAAPRPARWSDG